MTVKLEVTNKDRRKVITLDCKAYNQEDKLVANGTAEVLAPSEKISKPKPAIPRVQILD